MVCAETSKRRARSSTITRPWARAILSISVWRLVRTVTDHPGNADAIMVRRFVHSVNAAEWPQRRSEGRKPIRVKAAAAQYRIIRRPKILVQHGCNDRALMP